MTTIQIAFAAGLANLLYGLFAPSPACIAIGLAVAATLWREHRLEQRLNSLPQRKARP
jgi:hypothetical protein